MPVQTAYAITQSVAALEGMLFDAEGDILSAMCDLAGGISFGRFVTKGSADNRAILPTTSASVTGGVGLGFSVFVHREQADTPLGYAENTSLSYLRQGRIWVAAEGAVTFGGAAFVRFLSGAGGTLLGKVRADADTATAVALPGATFRGTLAGAGMVVIEVNPTLP